MTVKQLIAKLNKMPPSLEVYQADHDHGTFETSGFPRQVLLINQDDASEEDKQFDPCFNAQPRLYVVIRP